MSRICSGSRNVDIELLQQCTEYEELDSSDAHIQAFWEVGVATSKPYEDAWANDYAHTLIDILQVMEEMSAEERTEFLRFVWARSRMPSNVQDMPMNFKVQAPQGEARDNPDEYLPHAQTCFFTLSLPAYSTKEILKQKLLYAIKNSPNMDADVRLHSAEGWADA